MGRFPQYFTPSFLNSSDTFIKYLLCVGLNVLEVHSHEKDRLKAENEGNQ